MFVERFTVQTDDQIMRKFIIRLFPEQTKLRLKATFQRLNEWLPTVVGVTTTSSCLYYLIFSSAFRREMFAVLQGRKVYAENLVKAQRSSPLLRRNIHRLEKGLIMRPRRPVFAVDYIGETVDAYTHACNMQQLDQAELRWAGAVLQQYFQHCGAHPIIDKARVHFAAVAAAAAANSPSARSEHGRQPLSCTAADQSSQAAIPYRYADISKAEVSFTQLARLFKQRRSVRWFLPEAVPKELIFQAVEAASQAPSACNRQPFRFDLLLQPAAAQKVAALAMGTVGFAENIPCLLVVVGDLSCYPAERDRHVIYIDASLATMQLMLALETLGLSSCPINWPDIESREVAMANALRLPAYERPVMLLAVGYADPEGGIAFSQKKPASLLIREVSDVY